MSVDTWVTGSNFSIYTTAREPRTIHTITVAPIAGISSPYFTYIGHKCRFPLFASSLAHPNAAHVAAKGAKNGKNIQQRVFASGHPPNY